MHHRLHQYIYNIKRACRCLHDYKTGQNCPYFQNKITGIKRERPKILIVNKNSRYLKIYM